MAALSEAVETGTQACPRPLGNALPPVLPPALPPEIVGAPSRDSRQPEHPKLEDGRQLTIRLALSFALLIGIMLGLGGWASRRAD